jgi:hypothetical protein
MIQRSRKLVMAAILSFIFSVAAGIPARGQVLTGRVGQGRGRVGRVALPTPPFNPDAGILTRAKTPPATSTKATSRRRRPINRRVKAGNRNPRTTRTPQPTRTTRKRSVRR